MTSKKLDPHTTHKILLAIQVLCLLTVFIAAYKAMHLTGSAQIAKSLVSYLAFVVFLVVDMHRQNQFPWIR